MRNQHRRLARIVDPVSEPVPITEESHGSRHVDEYLRENRDSMISVEDRYFSTMARALLYIIEKLQGINCFYNEIGSWINPLS